MLYRNGKRRHRNISKIIHETGQNTAATAAKLKSAKMPLLDVKKHFGRKRNRDGVFVAVGSQIKKLEDDGAAYISGRKLTKDQNKQMTYASTETKGNKQQRQISTIK